MVHSNQLKQKKWSGSMKKILYFTAFAAVLFSCQREVEPIEKNNPEETVSSDARVFTATFEEAETKAGFTYDSSAKTYSHFWETTDQIAVFPMDNVYDRYRCANIENGTFVLDIEAAGTASITYPYNYAVYPYDALWNIDTDDYPTIIDADGKIVVDTYSSARLTEPYGYGNVMVARADGNQLSFKNLVGWIKISIQGDLAIKSLSLWDEEDYHNFIGPVYVEFDSSGEPVITPGSVGLSPCYEIDFINAGLDPVRLSMDRPTDFYFPSLPGTFEHGFTVHVRTTTQGTIDFTTTKSITVERNKVIPMAVKTITGPSATLKEGNLFNAAIKNLAANTTGLYQSAYNSNVKRIVLDTESNVNTGTVVSTAGSEKPVYANFDSGTVILSSEASTIYANADCHNMFYRFQGLENTPAIGLNTSNVTDMSSMFADCTALTSIDLSAYNTSNVTNMGNMFSNSGLTSIDLTGFNTSKVTNMSGMFDRCGGLTSLDVSGLDTGEVTDMNSMFYNCGNLTSLTLTGLNTAKVTNMNSMFLGCSNLSSLDFSSFNTSEVTDMASMFYLCSGLTGLDLSGFNTAKVTNMSYMFYYCYNLASLTLGSSFVTPEVTTMSHMFYNCNKLTSLVLSGFDFTKVTTTEQMFYDCLRLSGTLDLSSKSAPVLANMSSMFQNCSSLTLIKLPQTTTVLTKVTGLFLNCSSLTGIGTTNFNGRPTSVEKMFKGCSSLTALTLYPGFNTTDSNSYVSIFSGCTKLKTVDFQGLVIKGSGSPGLGGGTEFYAKFNNAFAGVSGCKVHSLGYVSTLLNTAPYNAFGTSYSTYNEGTKPTFAETTSHGGAAPSGYVYFCTQHSDYLNAL
jgi:surface protein